MAQDVLQFQIVVDYTAQRESSSVAMDTVLPIDNTNNGQRTMAWELGACSLFIDSIQRQFDHAFKYAK